MFHETNRPKELMVSPFGGIVRLSDFSDELGLA
jgi:hypothetical protein